MIKGSTGLVGLLGNPVKHSLSPVMQNAAMNAMGLDWRYLALPCEEAKLKVVLEGMHAVNCRGLNVTIPHKQSVANLCTQLSPLAERLGAVNTLLPLSEGGWHGGISCTTWRKGAMAGKTGSGDRLWRLSTSGGGWAADPSATDGSCDRTPG